MLLVQEAIMKTNLWHRIVLGLALTLASAFVAAPALAGGGHGGHGGHHGGTHFAIGVGFGFPAFGYGYGYGYGYPYSYYPYYPYYPGYAYYGAPYAVQQQQQVYVEQPQAQQPQQPSGYWYYCNDSRAYYPYVKECAAGWQRVAPQPQN